MAESPATRPTLLLADALFVEDQQTSTTEQIQVEPAEDIDKVPSQLSASAEPWHPATATEAATATATATAANPWDIGTLQSLGKQSDFAWACGECDQLKDFTTTTSVALVKIDPSLRPPPGLELPDGIPSHGSTLHALGRCKPCAWFHKTGGCSNDQKCKHCHLCPDGEIKARKRNSKKPSALQGDLSQEPLTSSASTVSPSSQEASVHSDSEQEWLSDDQEASAQPLKRTAHVPEFPNAEFSAELYARMEHWPEEMLWRQHYEQQCMADYWSSMDMGFGEPYGGYEASLGLWGGM